ncbi:MAG TPA: glycosyltransferase family 39 protein, partial [Ardenticatenaceae bacterium]
MQPANLRRTIPFGKEHSPAFLATHLAILLLAAALRFNNLGERSFWGDEIISATAVREPVLSIIQYTASDWGPPPVSYLLLRGWGQLVGESEFALRSLSVFFGVLSLPLLYQAGRYLLHCSVGLLASFVLALSTLHIAYSQELRPYSLLLFWVVVVALAFLRALRRGKYQLWVRTGLLAGLAYYSHQYILLFVGILAAWGALLMTSHAARASALQTFNIRAEARELGAGLGLMLLAMSVVVLPWYLLAGGLVGGAGWAMVRIGVSFLRESLLIAGTSLLSGYLPLAILLGALALVGLRRAARQSWAVALLLCGWIVLPLPAFMVIDLLSNYPFYGRQMLLSLPGLSILCGAGLATIQTAIPARPRKQVGILLVLGLLMTLTLVPLRAVYEPDAHDWRELGRFLGRVVQADEVVMAPRTSLYVEYYYERIGGAPVPIIPSATAAEMERGFGEHRAVWFVWSDDYLELVPEIEDAASTFLANKAKVEVLSLGPHTQ